MRSVAVFSILTFAFAAHAADWRTLASPPEYQAAVDLDTVKSQQGLAQFTVRRSYLQPQPHASGKEVHSTRVHYLGDCKANTVMQVVTESFGEDRKRIEVRGRKTVKRSELAAPQAGSEVGDALRLACVRVADLAPGDPGPSKHPDPTKATPPARSTTGTGIVVTREGHVLTNEHVVRQCDALELVDEVNARYKATLKASDAARDLALLAAETRSAAVAVFRKDPIPKLGEAVTIVGYPLVAVLGTRPSASPPRAAPGLSQRRKP